MIPQADAEPEISNLDCAEIIPLLTKTCEGCHHPFTYARGSHFQSRDQRTLCDGCIKARAYAKTKAWKTARAARLRAKSCVTIQRFTGPNGNPHAVRSCTEVSQMMHDERKLDELLREVAQLEANWSNQSGEETLAMTSALLAQLDRLEKEHLTLASVRDAEQSALAKLRAHPLIAQIWAEENTAPLSAEVQKTRDYFLNKASQKAKLKSQIAKS